MIIVRRLFGNYAESLYNILPDRFSALIFFFFEIFLCEREEFFAVNIKGIEKILARIIKRLSLRICIYLSVMRDFLTHTLCSDTEKKTVIGV